MKIRTKKELIRLDYDLNIFAFDCDTNLDAIDTNVKKIRQMIEEHKMLKQKINEWRSKYSDCRYW